MEHRCPLYTRSSHCCSKLAGDRAWISSSLRKQGLLVQLVQVRLAVISTACMLHHLAHLNPLVREELLRAVQVRLRPDPVVGQTCHKRCSSTQLPWRTILQQRKEEILLTWIVLGGQTVLMLLLGLHKLPKLQRPPKTTLRQVLIRARCVASGL